MVLLCDFENNFVVLWFIFYNCLMLEDESDDLVKEVFWKKDQLICKLIYGCVFNNYFFSVKEFVVIMLVFGIYFLVYFVGNCFWVDCGM